VAFSDSAKDVLLVANILEGAEEMNQSIFVVLTVLGLTLAGYFGLAAWRVSSGDRAEITGTILPNQR